MGKARTVTVTYWPCGDGDHIPLREPVNMGIGCDLYKKTWHSTEQEAKECMRKKDRHPYSHSNTQD